MIAKPARVILIMNVSLISAYRRILESALEDVHLIRCDFAGSRGGRIVPFESAADISGAIWDGVIGCASEKGYTKLILTSSELVGINQRFYEVAVSADSYFETPCELTGLSLCFLPPDLCEFILLVTTESYGLLYGSDHVISTVLGKSPDECMKAFECYVQTLRPELEGKFLAAIHRKYLPS